MDTKTKAILALIGSVFCWSSLVVVARGTVASIPPMTLLFLRLLVAVSIFFPVFIQNKPWRHKKFLPLFFLSILSSLNLVFFMWGIQFTTASASQLIYAAIPILIIAASRIFFKERFSSRKILGVLTGLLGIFYIIYLSGVEKGISITGSLVGNLSMVIAMICWMLYILFSKKISPYFSPVNISSVSNITSFIVTIPLVILEVSFINEPINIPPFGFWAAVYMGIFGTVFPYLLYQYAIRHTSALTAGLTSYIQPITTTLLAMIFLAEKLTFNFLLGALIVFLGVFLSTTLEIYQRRR